MMQSIAKLMVEITVDIPKNCPPGREMELAYKKAAKAVRSLSGMDGIEVTRIDTEKKGAKVWIGGK